MEATKSRANIGYFYWCTTSHILILGIGTAVIFCRMIYLNLQRLMLPSTWHLLM